MDCTHIKIFFHIELPNILFLWIDYCLPANKFIPKLRLALIDIKRDQTIPPPILHILKKEHVIIPPENEVAIYY